MDSTTRHVTGRVWNVVTGEVFPGRVHFSTSRIEQVERLPESAVVDCDILPGFVDAHMHQESTAGTAAAVAQLATPHGTVATVSDPHEIANVCGIKGIEWMLGQPSALKIFFGAPSCVPATALETAGAVLSPKDVEALLGRDDIYYLAEVMDVEAVLRDDQGVMRMIAAAMRHGKPTDGHAPGLGGNDLRVYAAAGISTDHECTSIAEATERIHAGMEVQIREGSAARNFEALHPLLGSHPSRVMFCTDDIHPHHLRRGHINRLVQRAIAAGYDPMAAVRAATKNPVDHYRIPVGLLQPGDPADLIVMDNLATGVVLQTFINGNLVAENGVALFDCPAVGPINFFRRDPISTDQISVSFDGPKIRAIGVIDGELITTAEVVPTPGDGKVVASSIEHDVLKLVLVNRYDPAVPPAVAFVRHFGLRRGALASSVAHDSHKVLAIGTNDADIVAAINLVIKHKGGLALVEGRQQEILPLPVAGLLSTLNGQELADHYEGLHRQTERLGSPLHDPLMALSFLALPVIPELKLTDGGLFDVVNGKHCSLFL